MAAASAARSQDATRAHKVRQAAAERMAAASVARSQVATRARRLRQAQDEDEQHPVGACISLSMKKGSVLD